MKRMAEMLSKYETLAASLEIIQQYLKAARQILKELPVSNPDRIGGLLGLTEYLARQSEALGVCA